MREIVKIENKDNLVICFIEGNIDITTSADIKKSLDRLIEVKAPKIIINMAKVIYIDSSGLATIVHLLKSVKNYNGRLALTNLSVKVMGLFEITKLEKLLEIFPTEGEAVAALK